MLEELKKQTTQKMDKAIEGLQNDLKKVRTGKATTTMLDPVKVNYYGTPTPLNQVASISVPDAKSIVIAPWETSILKEVESAIVKSDIGMSPQNDGKVIRLKVPELTEERRKDLVKNVKKTTEDSRVSVRMARREANDELKKLLKDKKISEDDQKKLADEIQKLTDEHIKKIDKLAEEKEKELMTI